MEGWRSGRWTAAWLWARADLRLRWRSWVVLGVLAGATIGLAAAGVAGARRTADAVPRFVAASGAIDAAVLPNDPAFDAQQRGEVAALPEVREVYPFQVPFLLEVTRPRGLEGNLLPTSPRTMTVLSGVLLEGRSPDAKRADEVVVDETIRRRHGLGLGSTMVVGQSPSADEAAQLPEGIAPDGSDLGFKAELRVVGIIKATSSDEVNWMASSGFYDRYRSKLAGVVNAFVLLENGEADFDRFQRDVQRITGRPTNVERGSELLGTRKLGNVTQLEERGLLLFALAVVVGGGALVGQALVRAVTAGAADVPTWRAIGADRLTVVGALALPALLTALIGAVTAIAAAIALSGRFPIGLARRYDIDLGVHADWLVLGLAALLLVIAVLGTAWLTAEWSLLRGNRATPSPSTTGGWATRAGLPPAVLIGTRLAVEPGRGRRAVPVRSAACGAVVGVLGVVACFTFRAAIDDTVTTPRRSGVVWDFAVVSSSGPMPGEDVSAIARDDDVAAALDALWARGIPINGVSTPTFGTAPVARDIPFVMLRGHAPRNAQEVAFGPTTLQDRDLHIGDKVTIGQAPGRTVTVVGEALLPPTSHTAYDQGAWMTGDGLRRSMPPAAELGPEDVWDLLLVRWKPGAHVTAAQDRLAQLGGGSYYPLPAELPSDVVALGRLRTLPLVLGVFFALLAAATVIHALVTTVRRRRNDLAVLRSLGLSRRQCRLAIACQSTIFAILGLALGIPLGIATARVVWRWLAENFPVAYVPPLALAAVLLIMPITLVVANALAAAPGHAAVRVRPAEALRAE